MKAWKMFQFQKKMDWSPAPIRIQEFFFENFDDESATKFGWCVDDGWKGTTLYIPVRRFCFLEDGATPRPTIRYYMSGDWLTAKEAKDRLAQL